MGKIFVLFTNPIGQLIQGLEFWLVNQIMLDNKVPKVFVTIINLNDRCKQTNKQHFQCFDND